MSDQDVPLKEFFETRLSALQAELTKAEGQLVDRLERMNEIRGAMQDQATQFITTAVYAVQHKSLEDSIRRLELAASEGVGRSKVAAIVVSVGVSALVGMVSVGVNYLMKGK